MSDIDEWTNDIHVGDARETLAELPESSVHMVMTSPPYFGLRDYGADGQIGLEDSLDEYIAELVGVFREVRRVLRPDGAAWLNLGDSYAGSGGSGGQWNSEESGSVEYAGDRGDSYNGPLNESGFGRKNKMLVPHRVAIALQADGWVVRNDCTWVKPNPMPSSVTDRLTTSTEQVFHLVPEPDYWYDLDAVREPYAESSRERYEYGYDPDRPSADVTDNPQTNGEEISPNTAGKNPGDVFEVTTKPFPEAHFAVYPPELCEKPIKATCPPQVCADCGAPYERDVDRDPGEYDYSDRGEEMDGDRGQIQASGAQLSTPTAEFNGWSATCDCDTDATEPGIALDPFAGAGTTARVAKDLGRRFVGIDLNPEYVAMAQKRVGVTVDEPDRLLDDDDATTLQAFTDGSGGDP